MVLSFRNNKQQYVRLFQILVRLKCVLLGGRRIRISVGRGLGPTPCRIKEGRI
uniref:Uncharacterized protein n=1 Tax=Anguilla anguilla TaxID=7936 RepID=A0A0E9PXA6_ANGAN